MTVPCPVIEDLLPLYHDGVCSPESSRMVDEHLAGCEACRRQLASLDGPVDPARENEEVRELEGVAGEWRRRRSTAFLKGATIVSALAWLACFVGFNVIGSHVEPDGTLVEPFYLIPIGFLFGLITLALGISLLVVSLVRRGRRR